MSNRVKSTGIIVRVHLPAASTRQHLCCCCRFCCIGNLGSLWCFVVCILTYGRSAYWPRFSQPFSLGCQLSPQMALISGKLVTPPPPPPLTHLNTFTCVPHTYLVPLHQGKVRQFLSQILDKNIFFFNKSKNFFVLFLQQQLIYRYIWSWGCCRSGKWGGEKDSSALAAQGGEREKEGSLTCFQSGRVNMAHGHTANR